MPDWRPAVRLRIGASGCFRQRLKLGVHPLYLGADTLGVTRIVDDVVGGRDFLAIRPLRSLPAIDLGLRRRQVQALALGKARDFLLGTASHDHQFVEAASYAGFQNQGSFHDSHGPRLSFFYLPEPIFLPGNDRGMDDAVQVPNTTASESQLCELAPIDASVGAENPRAEMLHNVFVDLGSRRHQLVSDPICLNNPRPELAKNVSDRAFAASEATGQAYAKQDDPCCSGDAEVSAAPRRRRAALMVFAISMAMVSGPTPPGTGVRAPATSATAG